MQPLGEVLKDCETLHGHMCAGQLLGARMALLGCAAVGLNDPKGADRKKLIVWVEIDRCMADAVSAVTGARLGKRSLKYVDYGKVAATFLNTETNEAVRIVALRVPASWQTNGIPMFQAAATDSFGLIGRQWIACSSGWSTWKFSLVSSMHPAGRVPGLSARGAGRELTTDERPDY